LIISVIFAYTETIHLIITILTVS